MNDFLTLVADRLRDRVAELGGSNANFNAVCERYAEVSSDLRKLEQSAERDAEVQADTLRRRRAAVEQELLSMLAANVRA